MTFDHLGFQVLVLFFESINDISVVGNMILDIQNVSLNICLNSFGSIRIDKSIISVLE